MTLRYTIRQVSSESESTNDLRPFMEVTQKIKDYALSIGFDAVGICKADEIDLSAKEHLNDWIKQGYQADMDYLSRNTDKRENPALLVDGAKSIVCVALNYYPHQKQRDTSPQFAYYAYGKDYHDVVKEKLRELFRFIRTIVPQVNGREFVDTAPILERYWAQKAGLGFIGKNSLLIIPGKGSFFFLGELIVDIELEYDSPSTDISCGNCTRCQTACPTGAFEKFYSLNSNKCISYQTIENRGKIDENIVPRLANNLYGCDICQKVCPFNKFSKPHRTGQFLPSEEFLSIDYNTLQTMTEEDYRRIFKGSAVKRVKFSGLMRNFEALNSKQID